MLHLLHSSQDTLCFNVYSDYFSFPFIFTYQQFFRTLSSPHSVSAKCPRMAVASEQGSSVGKAHGRWGQKTRIQVLDPPLAVNLGQVTCPVSSLLKSERRLKALLPSSQCYRENQVKQRYRSSRELYLKVSYIHAVCIFSIFIRPNK